MNKPKLTNDKSSELSTINITPEETDGKETPGENNVIDDEMLAETAPIVRCVLYATKENVLLVHEIFRQVGKFVEFILN